MAAATRFCILRVSAAVRWMGMGQWYRGVPADGPVRPVDALTPLRKVTRKVTSAYSVGPFQASGGWFRQMQITRRRTGARRTRHAASGQALAEFALILPILALLLLSIIQFAFIFAAQFGITNAVREAARLAAVTTPTITTTDANNNGSGVRTALTDPSTGFLKKNVFAYDSSDLVAGATSVCYRQTTDTAGKTIVVVRVQATYVHSVFIPLLDGFLNGIDGDTTDGGLRVGSSEEMRVENDEIVGAPLGLIPTSPETCS